MRQSDERPSILVAGGGVAALEACLALRSFLADDELRIELLAPNARFEHKPLSVLAPFGDEAAWGMALARFASDQDIDLVADGLAAVRAGERVVVTRAGRELSYDRLLVAVGGTPVRALPGALTFRGARDAAQLRDALTTAVGAVAFAAPPGTYWTLPLYELALLAAARRPELTVSVVSGEDAPLEAFGRRASAAVARVLERHGVRFEGGTDAVAADAGDLELADGRRLAFATVVSLPRLEGPAIAGLHADDEGFLAVDEHQRVPGADGVYAAGDCCDYPVKQGGLATQQADAAAEAILADLGLPIVPRPFEAVLQGVVYAPGEPVYVRSGAGDPPARSYSLWWPPSKIAGRHLSPYLTIRAGAPRAPEIRPDVDVVPVTVDVEAGVRATRSVLGPHPVPPA